VILETKSGQVVEVQATENGVEYCILAGAADTGKWLPVASMTSEDEFAGWWQSLPGVEIVRRTNGQNRSES